MDTKRIGLCIVFILCTGCSRIYAATVAATFDPQPVVLGQNTSIRCRYSTQSTDEVFLSMEMVYLSGSTEAIMAYLYPEENLFPIQWASTADQSIVDRAYLDTVRADNSLVVRFNDGARCTDQSMRFKCVLRLFVSAIETVDQVDLIVQAPPQAPTLVMSPDSDNVTEFSEVTFTCSGNVGLPAGSFQWFTFNGIDDQNMLDVTSSATETHNTPAPSTRDCTRLKTSELKLDVTRRDPGKKLVVQCRIQHDQKDNSNPNDCRNPDTDFCRMSKQIDVQSAAATSGDGVGCHDSRSDDIPLHEILAMLQTQAQSIFQLQAQNDAMKAQLDANQIRLDKCSATALFNAHVSHANPAKGEAVLFDVIHADSARAYDVTHRAYVIPFAGVYWVSVIVDVVDNHSRAILNLYADTELLGSADAADVSEAVYSGAFRFHKGQRLVVKRSLTDSYGCGNALQNRTAFSVVLVHAE